MTTVNERCLCGAKFRYSNDGIGATSVESMLREWRDRHLCNKRQVSSPEISGWAICSFCRTEASVSNSHPLPLGWVETIVRNEHGISTSRYCSREHFEAGNPMKILK